MLSFLFLSLILFDLPIIAFTFLSSFFFYLHLFFFSFSTSFFSYLFFFSFPFFSFSSFFSLLFFLSFFLSCFSSFFFFFLYIFSSSAICLSRLPRAWACPRSRSVCSGCRRLSSSSARSPFQSLFSAYLSSSPSHSSSSCIPTLPSSLSCSLSSLSPFSTSPSFSLSPTTIILTSSAIPTPGRRGHPIAAARGVADVFDVLTHLRPYYPLLAIPIPSPNLQQPTSFHPHLTFLLFFSRVSSLA